MPRTRASQDLEDALRHFGFVHVAGADEVGRGCLAGPVVAAAVVLDPARPVPGLADSKLLTPVARERLAPRIKTAAIAWAIREVSPADIDRLNIRQASLEAMRLAIRALVPLPGVVLVDGFPIPGFEIPQRGVVGGDRSCTAIAAASIIAKVYRDTLMVHLHAEDPRYGYDRHKGYGTPDHLAAIARHGYSPIHRRTFRPAGLFDTIEPAHRGTDD